MHFAVLPAPCLQHMAAFCTSFQQRVGLAGFAMIMPFYRQDTCSMRQLLKWLGARTTAEEAAPLPPETPAENTEEPAENLKGEAAQSAQRLLSGLTDEMTGLTFADYLRSAVFGPEGQLQLALHWPYAAASLAGPVREKITAALLTAFPQQQVQIKLSFGAPAAVEKPLPGAAAIVAVASGKGGVGKSTLAVNLAAALAKEGARVGLLDADIYGPSAGMLLGVEEGVRPTMQDDWIEPIERHGIFCMSMAFMTTERTPAVWRGPMAGGALQQLLTRTRWPDLDILLVDMPPGTGDIQLTLAQQTVLSGAVIVTSPQKLALLDAVKGIEMFRKVDVPILGVVENMSGFRCSHCGKLEQLFGEGGGTGVAKDYAVPLLACLPLDADLRSSCDAGEPFVLQQPQSETAASFRHLAQRLGAELYLAGRAGSAVPVISIEDD